MTAPARGRCASTATAARRPGRPPARPPSWSSRPAAPCSCPSRSRRAGHASRATRRATSCSRRARARGASPTGRTSSGRASRRRRRYLLHPGVVRGSTRGQPDRVQRYRYPAYTGALGLPVTLARRRDALPLPPQPARDQRRRDRRAAHGRRPAAVRAARARREPPRRRVGPADRRRPVADGRSGAFGRPLLGAARRLRRLGRLRGARGGAFLLRFWINDVTPPALGRLRVSGDARTLRVPVTDAGSGVDPRYLECALVSRARRSTAPAGPTGICAPGW